jgi:hypothetical protein
MSRRRADHSSRGVLSSVCVSLGVIKGSNNLYTENEWADRSRRQGRKKEKENSSKHILNCLVVGVYKYQMRVGMSLLSHLRC